MTKKEIQKRCERLFKEIVCLRADCKCEVCGGTKGITAHHFIPRSLSAYLKYDLDNGVCLCQGCHFAHHHKSEPKIHYKVVEKRGGEWYNKLEKKRKKGQRLISFQTLDYFKKIEKELDKQRSLL